LCNMRGVADCILIPIIGFEKCETREIYKGNTDVLLQLVRIFQMFIFGVGNYQFGIRSCAEETFLECKPRRSPRPRNQETLFRFGKRFEMFLKQVFPKFVLGRKY